MGLERKSMPEGHEGAARATVQLPGERLAREGMKGRVDSREESR